MSDERVGRLGGEIMRAWDSLVMDDDMLAQRNPSRTRHGWCCTFWSMHTMHKRTPPPRSVAIVTTHDA